MTQTQDETTTKRAQLVATIADYKKANEHYNTLFAFVYIKGLTNYSDDNCILILEQCDQRGIDPLTLMAIKGFSTWIEAGRAVRKGEKCFYILAPMVKRREDVGDEPTKDVYGFKCAFVFDVSQTDEMSAEDRAAHKTKASECTDKSASKQKRAKRTRRSSADDSNPYQQDQADTFTADERTRKADEAKQSQQSEQTYPPYDEGPAWKPYTEEHRQRAQQARQRAEAERQRQEEARRQAEREAADRERARRIFEEWEREQDRTKQQQQHAPRRATMGMNDSEARAILGIIGSITPEALKQAYRRAAMKHHPDHGGSEEAMKRVNLAHAYLKPYAR